MQYFVLRSSFGTARANVVAAAGAIATASLVGKKVLVDMAVRPVREDKTDN